MRASDKKINMKKANLLAESIYKQKLAEDFDYSGEELAHQDKGYHEHDMQLDELGRAAQETIQGLRGNWSIKKAKDNFIITNQSIPNKEMEIGLSSDRPEFKDGDYKYYYELKGVNQNVNPAMGGHQGNYIIAKSRFNNPAHLFISGKHPFEMWFK